MAFEVEQAAISEVRRPSMSTPEMSWVGAADFSKVGFVARLNFLPPADRLRPFVHLTGGPSNTPWCHAWQTYGLDSTCRTGGVTLYGVVRRWGSWDCTPASHLAPRVAKVGVWVLLRDPLIIERRGWAQSKCYRLSL